jgi:5-formaminoimidazole-4-carboxamide-1-beta-D-ribofuranosyl 5'-monophosphate synthetase
MLKLTSVKLLDNLYKKFKISNLDDSFTLQKLINRSMDLYVHNESFRKTITEHTNLKPSGSAL